jgi:hypothetical protein
MFHQHRVLANHVVRAITYALNSKDASIGQTHRGERLVRVGEKYHDANHRERDQHDNSSEEYLAHDFALQLA